MGAAANVPGRCKRCRHKKHSKQLDTIFCEIHFEFSERCSDFKLDKRRERFQKMCSEVMNHRTKQNGWSDFELDVKRCVLEPEGLLEGQDFKHNYKMQNEEQTGHYAIDFFLFQLHAILEVDGEAWHSEMGHGIEKDERRDAWFKKLGYTTFRVRKKDEYEAARSWIKMLKDGKEVSGVLQSQQELKKGLL